MTQESKPPFKVTQLYRNVERITEIALIMARFGFGDLARSIGLNDALAKAKKLVGISKPVPPSSRAHRVRLALEELGTVYIKLGQYLSTRQDIIPFEYLEEFKLLQDRVPQVPFKDIQAIINEELTPGALASIEEAPIATASVGQVHGAVLPDGQEVVVKVKRPGVDRLARTDLEIMSILAQQAQKRIAGLELLRPADLVAEYRRTLLAELNFRAEASNILRFHRLYGARKDVKIPALVRQLTTDKVIVMERLRGVRYDDREGQLAAGIDPVKLARLTAMVALEQVLSFGFFHADPHPGNLFAQPGPVVAFMDFGLIGELSRANRDEILRLAVGVVRQNSPAIARAALRLADSPGNPNRDRLETDIAAFLESHLQGSLKDINVQRFMNDIIEIMTQHRLQVPNDLLLLAKAIVQFESLGIRLDSDFRIMDDAGPAIKALYRKRFTPSFWLNLLSGHAEEAVYAIQNLPRDLNPLLETIKSGKVKADIGIEGFPSLSKALYRSSSRIALAIIISSLLLGSAHILVGNNPPHWHGMPVFGLLGLLFSLVLTVWLFIDHLRYTKN
jgi:ubiquinone biosynthesis protein